MCRNSEARLSSSGRPKVSDSRERAARYDMPIAFIQTVSG